MSPRDGEGFGRWQPIATAPRDGSPVLIYTAWADRTVGHWSAHRKIWIDQNCGIVVATHWMPLPEPPDEIMPDEIMPDEIMAE